MFHFGPLSKLLSNDDSPVAFAKEENSGPMITILFSENTFSIANPSVAFKSEIKVTHLVLYFCFLQIQFDFLKTFSIKHPLTPGDRNEIYKYVLTL